MTALEERPAQLKGQPIRRKEDPRLVTGETLWTDNIQLPGMLFMAVLRSPMAHARITRLDATPALSRPGVKAVYTAKDFEGMGIPCVWPVTPDMKAPAHPILCSDEVRYVGDAVAVVIADDRYAAADALEAIEVDYDALPAVVDMEAALADGAPLVHSDLGTNKTFVWPFPGAGEDYEESKKRAEVVVRRRYVNQRLIPSAMEPRSVVASPVVGTGEVTVWSATQIPHVLRTLMALVTGISEAKIRIIAPDVGGGFGSKLEIYREEVLATVIAQRLGHPVKWTASRSECIQATIHGRDQVQDLEITATREGKVIGLKVNLLADMGAYLQIITPGIPLLGAFMFNSIYKFDALYFETTGVFTNKTPTDAYRGAGRPEATFGIERLMDDLAAELGMDPMELRQKNWIKHEEFPFTTVAGLTYDTGNYEAATAKAMEMFDYDGLRAEQQRRRESNDPVQLGLGISTFTEMCGLAPSRVLASLSYVAGGWEHATIRVLPTGKVELITGTSPHGQGHVTVWSQITADALGVALDDVEVVVGDTARAPYGMDTYGSRSLVVGGQAIVEAAEKVVEKARLIAAHQLEADPGDVEFSAGSFKVKGTDASKSLAEIAFEAFTAHNLPDGMEPTLQGVSTVDPETFSYPHGTHLCAVEVDTETGATKIRKYVCVDDCGVVMNPLIVEGQVHGGLAQGIAQALYEEAVYDADGNLQSGSFVDYLVPAAPDLPHFETDRTETPATTNKLGVKGIGEAGTIASTPAVVNAVVDALRPMGVTDVRMPCSPQTVWRTIQTAKGAGQ
ncbi:MAG: xanthine dehydrogenase family protein molybdopterin-binding subunit [Motilibacteraceae bacterium]